MTKHQWIKSIFSSHIDPETDEELKGTKIETEGKFQKILKLVKDENEDSNKEPLVELIEDFHKQYQLLIKSSKNGRKQSNIEKLTGGIRHELEIANLEIVDLKSKLGAVSEESEALNSKYQIASQKVQESEEEIKRLVAEGEKLKHENADILTDNKDLIVKLQCASEMEAQLNHQLEELKNTISILTSEKETAVSAIEEERKVSDDLRAVTAQVRDEKEVLQLELDAAKGEVYVTKDNLQSAQQEIENLNQIQKVINEEKNSLSSEVVTLSKEIEQADHKIQDLVTESSQLQEKLNSRETELLTLTEMHEAHLSETDSRTRDLQLNLETLLSDKTKLENQKDDELSVLLLKLEENERDFLSQIQHLTAEKSALLEEMKQLQNKIHEIVTESSLMREKMDGRETELLTHKETHEAYVHEADARIRDLEQKLEALHLQITEMEKEKDDQLSALLVKLEDKERDLLSQTEHLTTEKSMLSEEIKQLQDKIQELVTESSKLKEIMDNKERDFLTLKGIHESSEDEATNRIRNLELELETLHSQKNEMEKQKDHELSLLLTRLEDKEKDALVQLELLKEDINQLQLRVETLQTQKSELEELLVQKSNEASRQFDELMIQINEKQCELESLQSEIHESDAQLGKKAIETSEYLILMESLKEELSRKTAEQTSEIDQLTKENEDLKDKISGLEKTLSEREDQSSSLEKKLEEASIEASALIDASAIEMNKLQQELESLHAENLKLQVENEGRVKLGKDLELQVDMVQTKIKELEDQLLEQTNEIDQLRKENDDLKDKISGLEKTSSEREDQYSALEKKLEEASIEASALLDASAIEINKLQQDLESLHAEKSQLELLAEKDKQESAKSLTEVEDQNIELIRKIKEQECMLKEQAVAFNELMEVRKQLEVSLIESKENLQVSERKIEEMTKEFHSSMELNARKFNELEEILKEVERELEIKRDEMEESIEDLKRELEMKGDEVTTLTENVRNIEVKLRLSNQKLRITEQVLSEKENEHTTKEEKYQKDNKVLHERIIVLSGVLSAYKEDQFKMKAVFTEQLNQTFTGLDSLTRKLEEDSGHIETCVFEILNELQVAKSWVMDKNNNEENQKKKITNLIFELNSMRQQESLLREQIENLVKTVKQLEVKMENSNTEKDEKIGAMEKRLNEKDAWISGLGEEKKEAIRQLCIWNDYHRERCVYLEKYITNRIKGRRQDQQFWWLILLVIQETMEQYVYHHTYLVCIGN
uniref:NAB domain-containing protein n=1 Tax=Daucus carota subsp. sativus TaxID=79200 RepID=A0A166CQB5_DAUCS